MVCYNIYPLWCSEVFHLQERSNDKIDIATYFNGDKGSIIVIVEKPAKLSYRVRTL